MLKAIRTGLTTLLVSGSLILPLGVLAPQLALAADSQESVIQNGLCAGINLDPAQLEDCDPHDPQAEEKIRDIMGTIINLLSLLVGIIAVIMVIIGGLRFILSGGDSSNVTSSRNTILYAIVGLVIVALAQFVVRFVLTKVTST